MRLKTIKEISIILCILILWESISLLIGSHYSNDVSGWWPVVLFFMTIIYFAYSILFILINKINPKTIKYIVVYNSTLTISLLIFSILFYTLNINWLAVNNGEKTLTLYQSIILNDFILYAILFIFLIIHFIYVYTSKTNNIYNKNTWISQK